MDALTELRSAHKAVMDLLEALRASCGGNTDNGNTDDAERLRWSASKLCSAEERCTRIEAEELWPLVRRAIPNGDDLADHVLELRNDAAPLLREVEALVPGTDEFDTVVEDLGELLGERIEYVECVVSPGLDAAVAGAARISLVESVAEDTDREALRSPTSQHSPTSPN